MPPSSPGTRPVAHAAHARTCRSTTTASFRRPSSRRLQTTSVPSGCLASSLSATDKCNAVAVRQSTTIDVRAAAAGARPQRPGGGQTGTHDDACAGSVISNYSIQLSASTRASAYAVSYSGCVSNANVETRISSHVCCGDCVCWLHGVWVGCEFPNGGGRALSLSSARAPDLHAFGRSGLARPQRCVPRGSVRIARYPSYTQNVRLVVPQ